VDLVLGRGNTVPVYPWFGQDLHNGARARVGELQPVAPVVARGRRRLGGRLRHARSTSTPCFTPAVAGDSAFIAPKQKSFSFKVTAKKGSKLYVYCAVHPLDAGQDHRQLVTPAIGPAHETGPGASSRARRRRRSCRRRRPSAASGTTRTRDGAARARRPRGDRTVPRGGRLASTSARASVSWVPRSAQRRWSS
jgi:hypothetical protein